MKIICGFPQAVVCYLHYEIRSGARGITGEEDMAFWAGRDAGCSSLVMESQNPVWRSVPELGWTFVQPLPTGTALLPATHCSLLALGAEMETLLLPFHT